MENFKKGFISEIQKIKSLKGISKKVEYIWEYYWYWILAIGFAIVFSAYCIYAYNTAVTDYWFYITYANTTADIGDGSDLYNEFIEREGFDLSKKNVEFNNQAYFDYGVNETGNSYFESFITYTDAGTLDSVTMTVDQLTLLGQSGRLLDLNSDQCKSIKEKYGDKFIYCEPYDEDYSDDLVPIGIDVSDSILMTEYKIYEDSCALGIGAASSNIDTVEEFLDFIFEEE